MKKSIVSRFLSLSLVAVILLIPSCSEGTAAEPPETTAQETLVPVHGNDSEGLDQALSSEIKIAYCEYLNLTESYPVSPNDVWVSYFGTYSDCACIRVFGDGMIYENAQRSTIVADYEIIFMTSIKVYLYKDHDFYTIREAYCNGLITKEDVYNIGVTTAWDIVSFSERIPIGSTYSDVCDTIGWRGTDIGSSEIVYEWTFDGGEKLHVWFREPDSPNAKLPADLIVTDFKTE